MKIILPSENISKIYKAAKAILSQRYELCDKHGHKNPDATANYCNYCDRHLIYESFKGRVERQKSQDFLNGLSKIVKELNLG